MTQQQLTMGPLDSYVVMKMLSLPFAANRSDTLQRRYQKIAMQRFQSDQEYEKLVE